MDIETVLTLLVAAGILAAALVIAAVAHLLGRLSSALFGWPARPAKTESEEWSPEQVAPRRRRETLQGAGRRIAAGLGAAGAVLAAGGAAAVRRGRAAYGSFTAARRPAPRHTPRPSRAPARAETDSSPAPDPRLATADALRRGSELLRDLGISFADWFRESPPPARRDPSERVPARR